MQFLRNLAALIVAVLNAVCSKLGSWFRPQEAARRRLEVERLDRLRHPSKYAGK